MPMPHRTFVQVAKRRLVGTEGAERVRVVRALLEELPDYRSGPYADIRKWLLGEIDRTRVRAKVVHRDSIAIRREGVAQVALVGPPNAGKSSLLQALSQIQIKTGDYAFTTTGRSLRSRASAACPSSSWRSRDCSKEPPRTVAAVELCSACSVTPMRSCTATRRRHPPTSSLRFVRR